MIFDYKVKKLEYKWILKFLFVKNLVLCYNLIVVLWLLFVCFSVFINGYYVKKNFNVV